MDTGCLVAIQPTVTYDIEFVGGLKSALFGGEGLFFATLRGPGRIWLQTLPFSRLASRIYAAAPQTGGRRREEGPLLRGVRQPPGGRRRGTSPGPPRRPAPGRTRPRWGPPRRAPPLGGPPARPAAPRP